MIGADQMRDRVVWRQKVREPQYPGERPLGQPKMVAARRLGQKLVSVSGDTVNRRVWWVRAAVRPGDEIEGSEIKEVQEVTDLHGNLQHRVCYGEV